MTPYRRRLFGCPRPRALAALVFPLFSLTPAFANADTDLGFSLGYTWTAPSDVHIDQPSTASAATFADVHWRSRSLQPPLYYGLRATRWFGSARLGAGAEFVHYKIHAEVDRMVPVRGTWNGAPVATTAPMRERVQDFNVSHGVNYVAANVLYRWRARLPPGEWTPYVGGGPVLYMLHPETTVNDQAQNGPYQTSGLGGHGFAGIAYSLATGLRFFAEVKFDAGRAKVGLAGGGHGATNLRTLHLVAGLGYLF
ncbi:MAG TPA: hypothetical protein VFR86_06685 [Burkholderiaceae bacterium]|nr:hypothetical protein [Burkholderiaceae bacterium]